MATYKTCQQCQQIVEWAPEPIVRLTHAVIYPWLCRGGNALIHCGLARDKAADNAAAEKEVGA